MNKLEKAVCSVINREKWLTLFKGGKIIGTVSIKRWKETKKEFMKRYVETRREDDGSYSLWITIDGIEAFFNADSFALGSW